LQYACRFHDGMTMAATVPWIWNCRQHGIEIGGIDVALLAATWE
jgi:hypothetical protein